METIPFFPKVITKIEQWIQGTLIAYQDAIKWLNDNKLIELVLNWKLEAKDISFEQSRLSKKSQVQYLKLN
jgi:hypothetical protein